MTSLTTIPTPAFVIDLARVNANAETMRARAKRIGVQLRPHVKTHKTTKIGKIQVGGDLYNGICVSTLAEAEHFASEGFTNITYAVPFNASKLPRLYELAKKGVCIGIFVDQAAGYDIVETFMHEHGEKSVKFHVFLKVDTGYHRAGVSPQEQSSIELAKKLAGSEIVVFRGVYSHAGHSYAGHTPEHVEMVAKEDITALSAFVARLREQGIVVDVVSVGSTPTCSVEFEKELVTEMHPGNYILYDRQQVNTGTITMDQIAGHVLCSVVSHHREHNTILVDAGSAALSADSAPQGGYGDLLDLNRKETNLVAIKISQEVARVTTRDGSAIDYDAYPIGKRLFLAPNHACLTAMMFPHYYLESNGEIIETLTPCRGW